MHLAPTRFVPSLLACLAVSVTASAQDAVAREGVPTPQPASQWPAARTAETRVAYPRASARASFTRGGGPATAYVPTAPRAPFRPIVSLALDGGASWYGEGLARAVTPGPAWGLRAGVDLLPFLSLEGRYTGAYNGTRDERVGPGVHLVTNGLAAMARGTLRLAHVQPYVTAGVGAYYSSVIGGAAQSNPLSSAPAFGIPLGIGAEVPIDRHWSLGGEGGYTPLFGGHFSAVPEYHSRELWSLGALVRYTL